MRLIDADKIMADIASSERSTSKDYSLLSIARYIRIQPTIEAEPVRHGKWTNGKCSECGCDRVITKVYRDDEVAWIATYKDNYCSYCGTKMDEVEE